MEETRNRGFRALYKVAAGLGLGRCPGQLGTGPRARPRPCLCRQEDVLSLQLSGHHEAGASDGNVAPPAPLPPLPFPALSPVLGQKGQSLQALSPAPACLPSLAAPVVRTRTCRNSWSFFPWEGALSPTFSLEVEPLL